MELTHPIYQRITMNPNVCFGKPCIRGLRFPVATLIDYLAKGISHGAVLEEFPYLEAEDIHEALAFSADLLEERFIPVPKAS